MRLKTHIRASALLRAVQAQGGFGAVLRKGDPDGGVLFVQVRRGREVALFCERGEGFAPRTEGYVVESEAQGVVDRETEFDRDLWVVEIEGAGAEALLSPV